MLNIPDRSLHRRKHDPWRSDRSWWRPIRLAARPVQIFHSQVLGGKFQVSCQRLGKLGVAILFLRSKKRNTFYHELLTATFHPCIHMRMDTHKILVHKYIYICVCVLHNLGMISKVIYRSSLWYCLICFLICFILFPKPYFITSIFPLHFDLRKSPVHMASVTNHLYRQLISNLEGLQEMECTWSRAS